jgi:hypothetical protein
MKYENVMRCKYLFDGSLQVYYFINDILKILLNYCSKTTAGG